MICLLIEGMQTKARRRGAKGLISLRKESERRFSKVRHLFESRDSSCLWKPPKTETVWLKWRSWNCNSFGDFIWELKSLELKTSNLAEFSFFRAFWAPYFVWMLIVICISIYIQSWHGTITSDVCLRLTQPYQLQHFSTASLDSSFNTDTGRQWSV